MLAIHLPWYEVACIAMRYCKAPATDLVALKAANPLRLVVEWTPEGNDELAAMHAIAQVFAEFTQRGGSEAASNRICEWVESRYRPML